MTTKAATDPAWLAPPDDATVARAQAQFATAIRTRYGDRVRGIYLFGSRARGDHGPESDADIAIVLADGDWKGWDEKKALIRLAYEIGVDAGLYIQPWPLAAGEWDDPARARDPPLVESAKRDGRLID